MAFRTPILGRWSIRAALGVVFGISFLASTSLAQPAVQPAAVRHSGQKAEQQADQQEVAAVLAELKRGVSTLAMKDAPKPYFAQMDWARRVDWQMEASYGGIVLDEVRMRADGRVFLRVGSPDLDNGQYFGGVPGGEMELSLLPDAELTRRKLWLAMDEGYRRAVGDLSDKKRALAKLAKTNEGVPSFSRPSALISAPIKPFTPGISAQQKAGAVKGAAWLGLSSGYQKQLGNMMRAWSGAYASNAGIEGGSVYFVAQRARVYHANSEMWSRAEDRVRWSLVVHAQTHAADGMLLDHGDALHGYGSLPRLSDLQQKGDELVLRHLEELVEMAQASRLDEEYDGPVLLSPRAAAQFLASTVAMHVGGEATPVAEMGPLSELEAQWQKKIAHRVMPDFVDLSDEPTRSGFSQLQVDADGVKAKKLSLVVAGVLKELLMTRVPNPFVRQSNGHHRMTPALSSGPALTHLVLSRNHPSKYRAKSRSQLEKELLSRANDDGYDFAYVIEEFRDTALLGDVPRESAQQYGGAGKIELPLPARIYRVEASGRKSPVRGALLSPISMRVLRRIRALGEKSETSQFRLSPGIYGGLNTPISPLRLLWFSVDTEITTPAWILDGLELTIERGEQQRLPRLPHPYAVSPQAP